ncbi:EAL domain-containing protein [Mitsuaria sp. WAJ17]|uniref:EAL domain-containing protein n=1 Tax=Mitsuaria sp. WAJ17 TaxID=2761452 RepID=UPI001600B2F6|nr:EAL domain-containing protein [Mitsuaria sp. WAJ17]MBB2485151.1 EAL domain-containing protein [Mitsuaria sp. WAJ17]
MTGWFRRALGASPVQARHAGLVCLAYLAFALLWIFFSDRALELLVDAPQRLAAATAKGFFFVLVTAALLYLGLRTVPMISAQEQKTSWATLAVAQSTALWYLLALVLSLSAMAVYLALGSVLEGRLLVGLFMLPVMLSAMLGGLGPGLFGTLISLLAALLALWKLRGGWAQLEALDGLQLMFLLGNSLAVSLLAGRLRASLQGMAANRQLLAAVVDGTTDAVFVKDAQGRYLMVNEAAAGFVGLPRDAILGRTDADIFPAESAGVIRARDEAVMAEGVTSSHEESLHTQAGQALVFHVTKGPWRDENGEIRGLFGISRDVSRETRRELALSEAVAAMREAQSLARVGDWSWELLTNELHWSAEIYRLHGRDPALGPARVPELSRYYTPAGWAAIESAVKLALKRGVPYEVDAEVLREDGSRTWITARGRAQRGPDGRVHRLVGTAQDIGERKRAELALALREAQLSRVLEGSDLGYWDWNVQTNEFQVSARWETMLGYEPGEMTVTVDQWPAIVHPDDFPQVMASVQQHLAGETPAHEMEMRCRTKEGEWRWIRTSGRVVSRDAEGRPLMMSGTHTDITERKRLELALREAAMVFDSSLEGIMMVDPQMRITKVNAAFCHITGYAAQEVLGKSPKVLSSGRQGPEFYREMWRTLSAHDVWRGEIWNRRRNGEIYAELLTLSCVRDAKGVVQHYIGVFSDISQIKSHEAELHRIAHYDPLTGVPNRRLLVDRLHQALARAARSESSLAVCFLDLDGFKFVNDAHGHAVGDRLLIEVTQRMNEVLRAEDTLARLGGDEFVVLLTDISSERGCTLVLERLLQVVQQPICIEGLELRVTVSIGVSLYPHDNADADTLMRHADQAMYLAKEAGKNRYQLFDPVSDRRAQSHREFLQRLQKALEAREFVLHYQPKVDLVDGRLQGVEALIRWNCPGRGLVQPGEFLPQLQSSRLELALGEWVIEEALSQAQRWREQGLDLRVSVNISPAHLQQPDFHDKLEQALRRHPGQVPRQFELEVLETAQIEDMDAAVAILKRCGELGVRFALDDFGTGYSSLTYLRKLPVQTLKIDQSFVRGMLGNADDMGIVEGVIRMARAFRMDVVAEGVETLEHGRILLQQGCRLMQGYGIGRPMPAQALAAWLLNWQIESPWLALQALTSRSEVDDPVA